MNLSLIGPDRREATGLGRMTVTIADLVGGAIGTLVAVLVIATLLG